MIYAIYLVLQGLLCFQLIQAMNTQVVWLIVAGIVFWDMNRLFLQDHTLPKEKAEEIEAQLKEAERLELNYSKALCEFILAEPRKSRFMFLSVISLIANVLIFVLV